MMKILKISVLFYYTKNVFTINQAMVLTFSESGVPYIKRQKM